MLFLHTLLRLENVDVACGSLTLTSTDDLSSFGESGAAKAHLLFMVIIVIYGPCLVTLPGTINEAIKWLASLPILMRKSFWW